MTVEPTAAEQLDRVREKARELWGDTFTTQLTLWEDGDYAVKAWHADMDDERQEELRHASGKQGYDEALLATRVAVEDAGAPHDGEVVDGPEVVALP